MKIIDLYNSIIQNTTAAGELNLIPGVLSSGGIYDFYITLITNNSFIINNTKTVLSADKTSITITGDTSAFGLDGVIIRSLVFTADNDTLLSNLKAEFGDEQWDIAGIDWFSIEKPQIGLLVSDGTYQLAGSIGGVIHAGTDLLLSMNFPTAKDKWLLQGSFDAPYPSISNFYQLLGGVNLAAALPQPFSTLTDLGLQNIDVLYDTAALSVSYMGVSISTSPNYCWQLLPTLEVTGIAIAGMVTNPGDSQNRSVSFVITGSFTIGPPDSNLMVVNATAPNFSASVGLEEGTVQLGDLLTMFLPDVTLDLNSEITAFYMQVTPASQEFLLTCNITADWTFLTISENFKFTLTGLALQIECQQGKSAGLISGTFHIGPDAPDGVDLTVFAGYTGSAWQFGAKTGTGQTISLSVIAFTFLKPFGMNELPDWVSGTLSISDVSFLATVPDANSEPSSYQISGNVIWDFSYGSFNFPSFAACVDITYSDGKAFGTIAGSIDTRSMLGLQFIGGYSFGTPDTEVYLDLPQFACKITYSNDLTHDVITIVFADISLGEIISTFIHTLDPSFSLPPPWSLLNSVDLSGTTFTYTRYTDNTQSKIEMTLGITINLGFLNIKNIRLTRDVTGVFLGFDGTFLGLTITTDDPTTSALAGKGSNVQNMPAVPGMGSQAFDLHFLGLGQHIALYGPPPATVSTAITALSDAFDPPNADSNKIPLPPTLKFDQGSNWLIGTDFTVAKFYRLSMVFNDPDLYGLAISIDGGAEFFKGLEFEILYKKINDSIGMYQIDLQVPDQFRQLEFGEVSITLPVIGIQIYTNGNFYLDFGFPASITNFSRSFTIQMFPFTGSGGFYFGLLSGATSSKVPKTTCGVFNPVIEVGLGLQLGVGKSIEQGILKAGLSLTLVGIFQGVLAFFRANPNLLSQNGQKIPDGTYYWVQATVGLVGHIYGEVNFAIISARLDILAYVYADIIIESYMAIPVYFEAGVSVSLRVSINLGLFKIHVSLSFSTTISASFVIGHDHPQDAPWNTITHQSARMLTESLMLYAADSVPVSLYWRPISVDTGTKYLLDLYFIPYLTQSGEGSTPGPQYVAMFFLDNGTPSSATEVYGVTALTQGVLYWAMNALLGGDQAQVKLSWLNQQTIKAGDVAQLLNYINSRTDNVAPFNYRNSSRHDIVSFLQAFFTTSITAVDPASDQALQASVFPVLPELQLKTSYNGASTALADFATQSMTGSGSYIADITALLHQLSVDYQSALTATYYATGNGDGFANPDYENQTNLSLPTVMFTDFIAMVMKSILQNALDLLNMTDGGAMSVKDLVDKTATDANVQSISGMASRFLLYGLRLPVPPDATKGAVMPLYMLTGQQFAPPATLKKGDSYAVNIAKPVTDDWIVFSNAQQGLLTVSIDDNEIQRVIDLRGVVLNPSLQAGYPRAITDYHDAPQSFTLGSPALWQYPGEYFSGLSNPPTLYKLPSSLQLLLPSLPSGQELTIYARTADSSGAMKKDIIRYAAWATTLNVTLQKITAQNMLNTPLSGNMYNLIGADDASIVYLQNILIYMQTQQDGSDNFIGQLQWLYQADPVGPSPVGYVSAANGALQTAIVRSNMSTETNPTEEMMALFAMPEAQPPNTLNEPGDFVKLLWECSIVRSGGFYLYYATNVDSKGLPDYLFDADGNAQLTLAITYNAFIPQSFINSVVIGDALDSSSGQASVYAQSDAITTRVAMIQPGCVGYQVVRNNPGAYNPQQPVPSLQDDQVYLQNQFNLIGSILPGITAYKNLMPTGFADSLSEDDLAELKAGRLLDATDNNPWNYSAVIPYYKFVQAADSDPIYPNPYAGIGSNVAMQLNWQDMFGNMPTAQVAPMNVSMPLLYSDPLVAVSQWPSMSTYYLFTTSAGTPTLQLNFCFDTSRYTGSDPVTNVSNASIDLQTYMRLYFQLGTGDVVMNYQSSIDGTTQNISGSLRSIDIAPLMTQLIKPITVYLNSIVSGVTPIPVAANPYMVSSSVSAAAIASYDDIFPLQTQLTMQRTAHIAPEFQNVPGVATAITTIQAQTKTMPCGAGAEQSSLSLTYFAQQFETTFADQPSKGILLKLTTGTNVSKGSSDPSSVPPLWVVRFDATGAKGIRYRFDNQHAYFFAPAPLANSLLSFSAPIYSYITGQNYPVGNAVTRYFSGVALDTWGEQFLAAVDKVLSPAYAVPAFLLDNGVSLNKLLEQKEALAAAIENTVDFIIQPTDQSAADIAGAKEKWRQQILIQLANAYRYVAAVQTPVQVDSPWSGSNREPLKPPYAPRLYGGMVGVDPSIPDEQEITLASTEYALSTAKVSLNNGASWLNYMFESKDAAKYRSFKFATMRYSINHIEQQIQAIDGIDGYLASSWLTFILPLVESLGDIGPITIPVALRAYPSSPSLTAQSMSYPANSSTQPISIDLARRWNFNYNYRNASAAQDVIYTKIQFNLTDTGLYRLADDALITLDQALAQFISVYPTISADFDLYLANLTAKSIAQGDSSAVNAQKAFDAFLTIVTTVASAWNVWTSAESSAASLSGYTISETGQAETGYLLISITADNADLTAMPIVNVLGSGDVQFTPEAVPDQPNTWCYQDATGAYLLYKDRNNYPERQVSVVGLDILNTHNALSGVQVFRNEELLEENNGEWQTTNPSFIYQSPFITFYDKLVPLLDCKKPIDIASIATARYPVQSGRSLTTNLEALFDALTQGVSAASLTMKVVCDYVFIPSNGTLSITLPVLLIPIFDVSISDSGLASAKALATALNGWLTQHIAGTPNGSFLINVTVYSASDNHVPSLQLPLTLSVT